MADAALQCAFIGVWIIGLMHFPTNLSAHGDYGKFSKVLGVMY